METLKFSDKLKSAVVQFYNKYYRFSIQVIFSANLMKLVIFGREGVDVLEIWAK
jgi:secreted Zn-dependent insulinase-like peptidase